MGELRNIPTHTYSGIRVGRRIELREHQTVLLDLYDAAIPQQHGRVPCGGVAQFPRFRVPDALISARPDTCGGYHVSGIPTAISRRG